MRLYNQLMRKLMNLHTEALPQDLTGGMGEGTLAVPEIAQAARQAAADGIVLLQNEEQTLPLAPDAHVAVFGRCAFDPFVVGYGSGGDVRPPYKTSLMDGLDEAGVQTDPEVRAAYEAWRAKKANQPDEGFWGHWPMSYPEMPLGELLVASAASRCDTALVLIGRAAGEDRENVLKRGSYYLTKREESMLSLVTKYFKKTALIMQCGNLIDFSFFMHYPNLTALLLAWPGGMEAGRAIADVLTGAVNPSGHLTDTVAKSYEVLPSAKDFGGKIFNNYTEDIYVGYRYFETFRKSEVLFPFGWGLSYTDFAYAVTETERTALTCAVTNTGAVSGRAVLQVYLEAPQGRLGRPARTLLGFAKTGLLAPGEEESLTITWEEDAFAVFDDTGAAGHRDAWVTEPGEYGICAGWDVRSAERVFAFTIEEETVRQGTAALLPPEGFAFDRLVNREMAPAYEPLPVRKGSTRDRILARMPKELKAEGPCTAEEARSGRRPLTDFAATLSDEALIRLTRGYGPMDCPDGLPGNAGALGGVTEKLRRAGIPEVITTDGPSGIRCRKTVSLLPCGTALATSFDPAQTEALYGLLAKEMKSLGSDVLLAPGMNIHRNPLCGRNFEYYSEDPLLSGLMAAAAVRGLEGGGVSACPKHFATNNQETRRNTCDSRVSLRALREIYLKNFEIMLKNAQPTFLMMGYNKLNGVWCHYSYDLATTILRKEWGFAGCTVTDWWMQADESPEFPGLANDAWRVRAGVDVLMPGSDGPMGGTKVGNVLMASLTSGTGITRAELQQSALRVIRAAWRHTRALEK